MRTFQYKVFERIHAPRPVNKTAYIKGMTKGQCVCDIGALDETAYTLKQGSGLWLHEEIAKVAQRVIGLDTSPLIQNEGLKTFDNAIIYPFNVYKLKETLQINEDATVADAQILVAGKLIEHLENPLEFLSIFVQSEDMNGKKLILTTPNACSFYNSFLSLFGMESTHRDHVNVFSYKILNTLYLKARAKAWSIQSYYTRYSEMLLQAKPLTKALVFLFERLTNAIEFLFPLKAGGYIVKVEL